MGLFSRKKTAPPSFRDVEDPLTRQLRETTTNDLINRINTPAPPFPGKTDDRFNAKIPDLLTQTGDVLSKRLSTPTINPDDFVNQKVRGDFYDNLRYEMEREFDREMDIQKEMLAGANLLTSGPGFQRIDDLSRDQSMRAKGLRAEVEKEALDRYFDATQLRESVIGRDIDQSTGLGNIFLESDEKALDRALSDFTRQQEQDLQELGLGGNFSKALQGLTLADLGIATKAHFDEDSIANLLGYLGGDFLGGDSLGGIMDMFGGLGSGGSGGGGGFDLSSLLGGGSGGGGSTGTGVTRGGGYGDIFSSLGGSSDVFSQLLNSGGSTGGSGNYAGMISNLLGSTSQDGGGGGGMLNQYGWGESGGTMGKKGDDDNWLDWILQGAGNIIGAYYGGPQGASMGGQVGNQIGSFF